MKDVVIFGIGQTGELLASYLEEHSGRTVAAFSVDREYMKAERFCDRPVVPFDKLAESCPPAKYDCIVAVGYANLNRTRAEKVEACLAWGYELINYIHPSALLPSGFVLEPNVIFFEGVTVQKFSTLAAGTIIWPHAAVGHHVTIEKAVFVGPGSLVGGGSRIGTQVLIGAGAIIRDFLTVGAHSVVGAGSTLLRDLPEGAVCNAGESPVQFDKAKDLSPWPPKTQRRVK